MKKKEAWMFKGAKVLALGKPGVIKKMQENNLDGVDYVYYITVRLDEGNLQGPYHPADIKPINY